jgi:hypothetical protein
MMGFKTSVLILSLVSSTGMAVQPEICGLIQSIQYSRGRLFALVQTTNNKSLTMVSNDADRGPTTSILTTALLTNKTTCFASDRIVSESSPPPIGFDSVRISR